MNRAALHSYMSRARYGVISSLAGDGSPQSALVGIALGPELEIVFDTLKKTRKYAQPDCAPCLFCCAVVEWRADCASRGACL